MAKTGNREFFWPSYVDLMTNLFAVMLVLFVVSFFLFKAKMHELEAKAEELKRIQDMTSAIQSLNDNPYFVYDPVYQKHILNKQVLEIKYNRGEHKIPDGLQDTSTTDEIWNVGASIIETIYNLEKKYVDRDTSEVTSRIKFLVVIEGQASADHYHNDDYFNNDVLSYNRALFLKKFWLDETNPVNFNGTQFKDLSCELIVSGSGEGGSPREADLLPNGSVNTANQRFLVHVVPVIDWNLRNKQ